MAEAPQTREAFAELLASLGEISDRHLHGDETFMDVDVVEGYRAILHLLSAAVEHRLDSDPDRPFFSPVISPMRKMLGDNPDAKYYWTRVRGDRSYRVWGQMLEETYLSFTVHGVDPKGGALQEVLADINHHDLALDSEGRFEILLGPERPDGAKNFIKLDPSAESIITRHYYSRPVSANCDPEVRVDLFIEPAAEPGPPEPWNDGSMAAGLREVTRYLRAETVDRQPPDEMGPINFVSREPNQLPTPASFRNAEIDTVGAVDIFYAMCPFVLGPDDAFVMEGYLPEAPFINVILWNRHLQTLEYRHRQSALNDQQLVMEADRRVRVVVAGRDPGVPNWLDTDGRMVGTVFWRYLLPEEDPELLRCSVVPIADLM